MKNCRDSAFSHSGLEVGRPAFRLPMFATCDSLPTRDLFDMFVYKESIPAISFGNPLATRTLRNLKAVAHFTSSALLHHAHLFVAAEAKNLSHAEKQRVWSRSCGLEELLQYADCAPM